MNGNFLEGLKYLAVILIISALFGLWKLIEISTWLFQYVNII